MEEAVYLQAVGLFSQLSNAIKKQKTLGSFTVAPCDNGAVILEQGANRIKVNCTPDFLRAVHLMLRERAEAKVLETRKKIAAL